MVDMRYPVVIHPLTEEDGGGYMAYAPDLPGCIGDGETGEAAVTDLHQAVLEWIDEATRLKREVPPPGDFMRRVRQEREQIQSLLTAQDELIKKQGNIIKQQDQGLKDATKDIERIKAGILHLLGNEGDPEKSYLAWVAGSIHSHLPMALARRKQSSMPH